MLEFIEATELHIAGRTVLAMVFGAVIGFERERSDKPAGLRTNMLIAGAACLFVLLADLSIDAVDAEGQGAIRSDPIRVFEAILVGISFLGAGTIIRHPDATRVEGLTTAAALLFSGGVGIAVGVGQAGLALLLALLAFALLRGGKRLETWLLEPDDEDDRGHQGDQGDT